MTFDLLGKLADAAVRLPSETPDRTFAAPPVDELIELVLSQRGYAAIVDDEAPKLSMALESRINAAAAERGVSPSVLINDALDAFLK